MSVDIKAKCLLCENENESWKMIYIGDKLILCKEDFNEIKEWFIDYLGEVL